MNKVKIAVIGCGSKHALSAHIPQLTSMPEVSIEAFCDLDEEKLLQTQEKYKVSKGYSDFQKMINEVDLDAVFITTKSASLRNIAIPCFQKGLAVNLEKSPGCHSEEIEEMFKSAEKNGCYSMVGFYRRFSPIIQEAARLVGREKASNRIVGRFYRKYVSHCDPVDAVIHGIDMMRYFGGDVKDFFVSPHTRENGIRDGFNLVLNFECGATGVFTALSFCAQKAEVYEIHGSQQTVIIDYENKHLEVEALQGQLSDKKETFHNKELEMRTSLSENRHFIECLLKDMAPAPDLEDSLKTMRLAEAAAE